MPRPQSRPNDTNRWVIWALVVTLLTVLWSSAANFETWRRKGTGNVFEPRTAKPPLPDWLLLTVPAAVAFQLLASSIMIWRPKSNRLRLMAILLPLWLVSAVFSLANYNGPLS